MIFRDLLGLYRKSEHAFSVRNHEVEKAERSWYNSRRNRDIPHLLARRAFGEALGGKSKYIDFDGEYRYAYWIPLVYKELMVKVESLPRNGCCRFAIESVPGIEVHMNTNELGLLRSVNAILRKGIDKDRDLDDIQKNKKVYFDTKVMLVCS